MSKLTSKRATNGPATQSYDPFALVHAMSAPALAWRTELNRAVQTWAQAWRGFGAWPALTPGQPFAFAGLGPWLGLPAADVTETDDAVNITLELPGLDKDDVSVAMQGDAVIITGEKTEDAERASARIHVQERRFGAFERRFLAPKGVNTDAMEAHFAKGVLSLRFPKTAPARQSNAKPAKADA
ncbi:MAG: Hsp20/alpha crystallin family protein [Maricaulaceae bacterium]